MDDPNVLQQDKLAGQRFLGCPASYAAMLASGHVAITEILLTFNILLSDNVSRDVDEDHFEKNFSNIGLVALGQSQGQTRVNLGFKFLTLVELLAP